MIKDRLTKRPYVGPPRIRDLREISRSEYELALWWIHPRLVPRVRKLEALRRRTA